MHIKPSLHLCCKLAVQLYQPTTNQPTKQTKKKTKKTNQPHNQLFSPKNNKAPTQTNQSTMAKTSMQAINHSLN
jgi:hypothetical protein